MKCMHQGCDRKARWQVGFLAWAMDFPRTSVPIKGLIGLAVCDNHRTVDAAMLFPASTITRMNEQLTFRGKELADFKNAQITYTRIRHGKFGSLAP